MKDSGVEWIGEIPEEWELSKTKYITNLYTGNSIRDEDKDNYEDSSDAIPYLSSKDIDVTFSTANYENGLFIKKTDNSFARAPQNSSLMCIEGGSAGRKKTFLNQEVCFVNKLCCFNPININGKFLFYLINSPHYEEEFRFNISGMIGGVSVGKLNQFVLPIPPKETQQKIATYLDEKCSQIEQTIQNQQQVIEKLKAYKQSLITEAVTGRVKIQNGKVAGKYEQYKDSGVEWIGEIPEGWEVRRTKYLTTKITDGAHISPETENGIFDFISTADLKTGYIDFNNCLKTSKNTYEYFVITGCKPQQGDVLISKDGTVGKTVIVADNRDFVIASSLVILRPNIKIISTEFLNYSLQSSIVQETLLMLMHGSGLKRVSVKKNSNLLIVLPTQQEQKFISEYLDKSCTSIDSAIEQKQKLIEKLTEYKKSLIYECVTGKKEIYK